ncbi:MULTISPECIES: hypothetical protein [unclassified Bradyrhizobium]|uniref:hypothetical protein n=1 Tax=unclassified Bradyrhizobium TaxID=2631580 RepID=UPI002478D09A|nr:MULTISPECIES: hypothetical protein [unclassified Bradyrhizobium]WGS17379.1 hypothetical protein MTX22_22200 [Bradyrhizobium sp. ISRA463]WGS24149.1 hypothetical protein MTX19_19870 [Bradyrhizobium sp. ISRA464]
MPWFYFDLLVEDHPESQGRNDPGNTEGARDRADALAEELRLARSGLEGKHCYVRVLNVVNGEIYRTPLLPIPKPFVEATP